MFQIATHKKDWCGEEFSGGEDKAEQETFLREWQSSSSSSLWQVEKLSNENADACDPANVNIASLNDTSRTSLVRKPICRCIAELLLSHIELQLSAFCM